MDQLQNLRVLAERLDPQFAVVGFFSISGKVNEVVPLSDLQCITIVRNTRPRHYRGGTYMPALLSAVPVMYHDTKIHIGGPDWFYFLEDFRKKYIRNKILDPLTNEERTRPVGTLRDLFEDNEQHSMYLKLENPVNKRLADCAAYMLSEEAESEPGFNQWGERKPTPPRFLAPISHKNYLYLRHGDSLDQMLLHSATTGEWGVPGVLALSAPDSGLLRWRSPNSVELHVPLPPDVQPEALIDLHKKSGNNTCRVEGRFQVESFSNPTAEVERRIFQIFGVNMCPNFIPAVTRGKDMEVRAGRAMFTPLPRKAWTMEELRARPDYEGLCYLAALHRMHDPDVNPMLDLAVAHGSMEPWVELVGFGRVQRICYAQPGQHYYRTHMTSLSSDSDDHHMDMMNTSLQVEMRRNTQRRKEQRRVEELVPPVLV